ncbi:hypothetical protein DEJ51_04585 [Streptomyces venezuelae]|uniref:Uncharacterized protein n=1 Tax=Streptomyces venezuelae TaxID=54571 RepID=A0A5P2DHB0_STRVZ|nr:hypothetical protein [Streptomyces venezuelae]QES53617.1 hypothetical protein DEJ51_04585 [Streptomyces venezuelae]
MKALVLTGRSPGADRSVFFRVLEQIADVGITDVGIVLGGAADAVREAVGDGTRFGVGVTYLPRSRRPGPGAAVHMARDWLGDDDFVTYPEDVLVPGGIGEQVEAFRTRRPAAQVVPGPAGVYFFTDAVHRAVDAVQAAASGGPEITDLLRWLADQGLEVVSAAPADPAPIRP